jgi:hypothetical protein
VVDEENIAVTLSNYLFTDPSRYYILLSYGNNFEKKTSPIRLLSQGDRLFIFIFNFFNVL